MKAKRWLAVGCSHGHLIDKDVARDVLAFKRAYKPHTTLHLGDFLDQTAFMGSALDRCSKESHADVTVDMAAGLRFVEQLEPQVLFLGNHDARAYELADHPRAIIAHAARCVVKEIEGLAASLRADLVPYSGTYDPACWRMLGGTAFGHGFVFGMRAGEQHAYLCRAPVVFAHTHRVEVQTARTHGAHQSHNIGCLADIQRLKYAARRLATAAWRNAWAFGEYTDKHCTVEIHTCQSAIPQQQIPQIA